MGLFRKSEERKKKKEAIRSDVSLLITDEIDELRSLGEERDFDRADTETRALLSRAKLTDIKNILLMDQGRCPSCHSRTENFLFSVVCPTCGWFRRDVPESGRCAVHLRTGEKIECDYVHHGSRDEVLCISDGVVMSELIRSHVLRVDYQWGEGELEQAKANARRIRRGICSWCEASLESTPLEDHGEDYTAFGPFQERHVFCTEKCQRSFRKRYPSRVHRNCYETDCEDCGLCIKRYDTEEFRRKILR